MPTASARLQRKLDLVAPAFGTPGRLLLEDPHSRDLAPRFFAAGSYVTLAMVPLMETALHRPCAVRATTGEGREHLRLYFEVAYDDGTSKVGVAASYASLPLDRGPYPVIAKLAPRAPTPTRRRAIS